VNFATLLDGDACLVLVIKMDCDFFEFNYWVKTQQVDALHSLHWPPTEVLASLSVASSRNLLSVGGWQTRAICLAIQNSLVVVVTIDKDETEHHKFSLGEISMSLVMEPFQQRSLFPYQCFTAVLFPPLPKNHGMFQNPKCFLHFLVMKYSIRNCRTCCKMEIAQYECVTRHTLLVDPFLSHKSMEIST
jgi:hypothetical protein